MPFLRHKAIFRVFIDIDSITLSTRYYTIRGLNYYKLKVSSVSRYVQITSLLLLLLRVRNNRISSAIDNDINHPFPYPHFSGWQVGEKKLHNVL